MKTRTSNKRTWQTAAMLLGAVAAACPVSAAITDNLMGHFTLDETDTSSTDVINSAPGATENGTRTSTILIGQPAVLNTGYTFDGVNNNDLIALGSDIALTLPNTDKITISAWVNPSFYRSGTNAASRHTIVGTNVDLQFSLYGGGNLFFNYKDPNTLGDNGENSSGANNLAGGMTVPLNQWSNVAVTRDGTDVNLFINGIMVAHDTGNAGNFYQRLFDTDGEPGTPNSTALYIGSYNGGSSRDFDGTMDDVGIWSGRALNPQEIAAIAGLGAQTHSLTLGSSSIDDVLSVYNAGSGSVSAGGKTWSYTDSVAAPLDSSTLYVGKNYVGTDGESYIILGGTSGAYVGVTTAVPIPVTEATWDGGGSDNNWSSGPNWTGDATPPFTAANPSRLTFTGNTRTSPVNDVADAFLGGIEFDAGASTFTISGNGFTVIPGTTRSITNDSNNTQTISTGPITIAGATVNAATAPIIINSDVNVGASGVTTMRGSATLTVNGKISGAGTISKRDPGTLVLTNSSSDFSGQLQVLDGVISVNNAGALGSSSGTLAVIGGNSTGRFDIAGNISVGKQISIPGRDGSAGSFAPAIRSTGNNSLTNTITTSSGGSDAVLESVSGKLTVSGSVNGASGVNLRFQGAGDGEVSGAITGAGGVTMAGTGSLTLSGGSSNTYTGPTNVQSGTLKVTNAPLFSSNTTKTTITVENGATLDLTSIANYELQISQTLRGSGTVKAGTLTLYDDNSIKPGDGAASSVGTLSIQGDLALLNQFAPPTDGANLSVDLGPTNTVGGGVNDLLDVSGNLAVDSSSGAILVNVNLTGGKLAAGNYRLINYGGSKTGSASYSVVMPGGNANYRSIPTVDDTLNGQVNLVVAPGVPLTWKGGDATNPTTWDLNNTANFNNNTEKFFWMDDVTFDDTASTGTVDLVGELRPGSITVNNSALDYVMSATTNSIGGTGTLTKSGSGVLTINSNGFFNTWTGGIVVKGGVFATNQIAVIPFNNGISGLTLDGGTVRFTGPAQGTGRVVTLGTGGGTIEANSTGAISLGNTGLAVGFVGSGPRTLTFSGSFTGNSNFNGVINDGPGGATSVVKDGTTTWTLSSLNNSFSGGLAVNDGTLTISRIPNGAVAVNGGVLRVSAKGTANSPDGTSVIPSLSIVSGAQMDLGNNSMVIDYSGSVGTLVGDVRQELQDGRLISSSADAAHKIGYGDNAVLNKASFAGQNVDTSSLLVKYTYGGDANLDGQVDVTDLGALATNWQTSSVWTGGDFNYDGFVDVTDLGILATNWQQGVGSPLGASLQQALASVGLGNVAVPEPSTMTVMIAGLALSCTRRRRQHRT